MSTNDCRLALLLTAATLAPLLDLRAAILTNVPMQGTMVMPVVKHDATQGRLAVTIDPAVPQLTPLLVSNPEDHFDQADPWFSSLDPGAEGLAFSRRYGFVMDAASDPLPNGTAIAIRKSASSAGLEIFRYRSSVPKVWEPIFGTAGSSDTFDWDGMMFHPCVTAPSGTNNHWARFEAFLTESDSGRALPETTTGEFELHWTNRLDGRPRLAIAPKVAITVPAASGWALESADHLRAADWLLVTNAPVLLDGVPTVVLDAKDVTRFYRMRRSP
ncbi:MAG: hypothetical protein U1G07_01900 [Verrucomicrobiota bacterium]